MARAVRQGARVRIRTLAIVAGVSLAGFGTLYAKGGHTVHSNQTLTATSNAPSAHGKAHLTLQSSKKGKFSLVATHLKGNTTYDVIVRGVKVTQIHTSNGGSGKALFSTKPNTKSTLLGFDPSGGQVLVRETDDGEDVLVGGMPEDNAGEVACCLSQGEDNGQTEVECEDMTAAECTAEGGTVGMAAGTTAASCLPDPCATTPPPNGIVCCTNATDDDQSEAECEDVTTQAECADNGGTVVQAASCDPNPCQVTPPTDQAACCITQTDEGESETECKVISSAACTAAGGTAPGAATCDTDPCGSGNGTGGGDGGGGD